MLFVNIVDRTAASVIVDKAQEAGAPLIFFNRQPVAEDINYRGRVYYVGAIDAIREWGGPMPLVVGVDATAPAQEAVAAGDLYGTVLNDAQGQAKAMVDLALALMDSRGPDQVVELQEDHYVWLPYRRVDRDNLEETAQDAQR